MEKFFSRPSSKKLAEIIYNELIFVHETGGKSYRFLIPDSFSISFINEVIERLCDYIHDAEIIQLHNGYIIIEWC